MRENIGEWYIRPGIEKYVWELRRHPNGQQTHTKMPKFTGHKENVNQTRDFISPPLEWLSSQRQKYQMPAKIQRNDNPYIWKECKFVQSLGKIWKLQAKTWSIIWFSNSMTGYMSKGDERFFTRKVLVLPCLLQHYS
jgi:hypothetical protein